MMGSKLGGRKIDIVVNTAKYKGICKHAVHRRHCKLCKLSVDQVKEIKENINNYMNDVCNKNRLSNFDLIVAIIVGIGFIWVVIGGK